MMPIGDQRCYRQIRQTGLLSTPNICAIIALTTSLSFRQHGRSPLQRTQMGVRRHVERDLYFRKELTMKEHVEDEVIYYYDLHPTEEDLMGETSVHRRLVTYLAAVLRWLFHEQVCAVYENLNFYQTRNYKEYPVAPDLAVIKD